MKNLRASFVLVKENNKWLIAHKHISLPTSEHEGDEAYPLKEFEERNAVLHRMMEEKTQELNDTIVELETTQQNLMEMNREKDKFFSIVAHDIKSPFNTLLGFTDLLANTDRSFDETQLKKIHKNLFQATQKTHNLLENLLEWAGAQMRKSHVSIEEIYPYRVLEEVINLFYSTSQDKEIQINNEVGEDEICLADENILKLVFRNLISNAIKFSHHKSQIVIFSQHIKNDRSASKDLLKLIVKDFGVGMSSERVNSLFSISSSFSTYGTNNECGSGLGLIFTKDMLECLNGEISAESEEGRGTEIGFTLEKV